LPVPAAPERQKDSAFVDAVRARSASLTRSTSAELNAGSKASGVGTVANSRDARDARVWGHLWDQKNASIITRWNNYNNIV
jgi:hypothetical protein